MESIAQITKEFIEKFLKVRITDGIGVSWDKMNKLFREFVSEYMSKKMEEIDSELYENENVRNGWEVVKKGVARTLICEFGKLTYKRRYYKNKISGCRGYLADVVIGIEKGSKIETGLGLKLIELSTDNSYEKSANLVCDGQVSKQSVMNKTRQAEDYELPPVKSNNKVKELHIQADEDHVSLQNGKNTIVKLVTVHERNKFHKKKSYLPQKKHYASHKKKPEEFWVEIANDIAERYGDRDDLKIYIHGDGGNWIKTGLNWIPNSVYVLDRFHLHKAIDQISCTNFKYKNQIFKYLRHENYEDLKIFLDTLVYNDELKQESAEEIYKYLYNNRQGIYNLLHLEREVTRSCTEGQVSHVLSDRLSRRPCGWLPEGLETITQLRVFYLNGGKLSPENMRHKDEVLAKHETTIIEIRSELGQNEYEKNINISTHISKCSNNKWLKGIATGGLYDVSRLRYI